MDSTRSQPEVIDLIDSEDDIFDVDEVPESDENEEVEEIVESGEEVQRAENAQMSVAAPRETVIVATGAQTTINNTTGGTQTRPNVSTILTSVCYTTSPPVMCERSPLPSSQGNTAFSFAATSGNAPSVEERSLSPAPSTSAAARAACDKSTFSTAKSPNACATSTTGASFNATRSRVSSSEEDDEAPSKKAPRLEDDSLDDDEGGCTICCLPFENAGPHRICCLKCGHIYGMECIKKWLDNRKNCPDCNKKAFKGDMRVLYIKNLKAKDTAEVHRLKELLREERERSSRLQLDVVQLKYKLSEEQSKKAVPSKKTADQTSRRPIFQCSIVHRSSLRIMDSTESGEGRVGVFNHYNGEFINSKKISCALYPSGGYCLRKQDVETGKLGTISSVREKTIRDLSIANHSNLLLSVGLDSKAVIADGRTDKDTISVMCRNQLWSGTFDDVKPHLFHCGSSKGDLFTCDIRQTGRILSERKVPLVETYSSSSESSQGRYPVGRLASIKEDGQVVNGLIVQDLKSVWFIDIHSSEPRFIPLFSCVRNVDNLGYDKKTNHMFVSLKQNGIRNALNPQKSHFLYSVRKNPEGSLLVDRPTPLVAQRLLETAEPICLTSRMLRSACYTYPNGTTLIMSPIDAAFTGLSIMTIDDHSWAQRTEELVIDVVPFDYRGVNFFGLVMPEQVNICTFTIN